MSVQWLELTTDPRMMRLAIFRTLAPSYSCTIPYQCGDAPSVLVRRMGCALRMAQPSRGHQYDLESIVGCLDSCALHMLRLHRGTRPHIVHGADLVL